MKDFEQLGMFYLGKPYDTQTRQTVDEPLLYDAKDLTTHAVCVGMTGSGKTGLCLSLLEEAAIDGIPAICIDPKGDLGNLLLTFPELQGAQFRPWLEEADATRQGLTLDQLAEKSAQKWREGLAAWGQDGQRVQRFRDAVDLTIYTPGSSAGLPLTVLRSFAAPNAAVLQNSDAFRERVQGAVSGLLALLGIDGDPLQSREHILLANVFDRAWRAGRDLDMAALIREIQSPSFDKVGFVDLESFFPAKERFSLAMRLNNLLASPGFQSWLEGDPLDIQRLFYTSDGKPRLTIISIAHLSDNERMFFVTILLNELLAWMRSQSGTSSLRALLYMDEVFGYFPPTANPPSKQPMLTLLKQARAFGLGVVLATQNPVDLDYKGLSNAGTWFLGRLQTERDKARVLDGLEGAAAAANSKFDRASMETILSGLGSRVFLMNNVHEDHPVVFQSRWSLSFLRGPLTRDQITTLMAPRRNMAAGTVAAENQVAAVVADSASTQSARPVLPPEINECFLNDDSISGNESTRRYRPAILARAKLHYAQAKVALDCWSNVTLLVRLDENTGDDLWEHAERVEEDLALEMQPEAGTFAALPALFTRPKTFALLATSLKGYLYRTQAYSLFKSTQPNAVSCAGESEGDFRVRVSQLAKEARDEAVEQLRSKYSAKIAALAERVRKAQQKVEKEKSDVTNQMLQTAVTFGSSLLSAFVGRKVLSSTSVSKAATTLKSAGRVAQQRTQVGQAEETVEALQQQSDELSATLQSEIEQIQQQFAPERLSIETLSVQPKKSEISVDRVALLWISDGVKH